MYAIINKKTKQFVYGTDYRQRYNNNTAKQRTSLDEALTYSCKEQAEVDMRCRHMSNDYEVIEVKLLILDRPPSNKNAN